MLVLFRISSYSYHVSSRDQIKARKTFATRKRSKVFYVRRMKLKTIALNFVKMILHNSFSTVPGAVSLFYGGGAYIKI